MDVDLILLQERCRKDPGSYKEDFEMQKTHFLALLDTVRLQPSSAIPRLPDVASFMGAVAPYYKSAGAELGPPLTSVLSEYSSAMNPVLRRAFVRLLALLRARNCVDVKIVIPLFFRLLSSNDKTLRRMLHGHIVSDLRRIQSSGADGSRRSLQSFLFAALEDSNETLVKRTLFVLVDLFRKHVWNDPRCANMIASACFHSSTPVAIIAARFLLDSNVRESVNDDFDDEDDDEDEMNAKRSHDGRKAADMWKAYQMTGKKSTKKRKRMEKVIARSTRHRARSETKGVVETDQATTAAMALLNDPQQFAERLLSSLHTLRKRDKYDTKLVFINLLTRLVGGNQLFLFDLYKYLERFLQPAQPEVTRVMAYLTQACHDLVPSDALYPILRCIADRFVSDRSSPPSVAAGINTIRAICARVPLAILDGENENLPENEQQAPLLDDLVEYKGDRDKGVSMAARSLISLYREVHPKLLHKKDRGRYAAEAVQKGQTAPAPAYSKLHYSTGVDGVELLAESDSDADEESDGGVDAEVDNETPNAGKEPEEGDEIEEVEEGNASGDDDEIEAAEVGSEEESASVCDDDNVEGDEAAKLELESKQARPDAARILTDEDFAKIRARRAARTVEAANLGHAGDSVNPADIQGVIRKERKTLEERLEKVLAGREGREKFGSRRGDKKGGGSTNAAKKKGKANSMVIHKRRGGAKQLSRRDKQMAKRRKRDYR